MDQRLQLACKGKSKSQGGLNVPDLYELAKGKGYMSSSRLRQDLLNFLCQSIKHDKPVQPMQSLMDAMGSFIEPENRMNIHPELEPVFSDLVKDREKLYEFFNTIPLTKSISHVLRYTMEHDGNLKVSSLVNRFGMLRKSERFKLAGLSIPNPKQKSIYELRSIASLTDECNVAGFLKFTSGPELRLPGGKTYVGLYQVFNTFMDQLKIHKDECAVNIMFALQVPGHAMILSVNNNNLYIFDTNDVYRANSWDDFWYGIFDVSHLTEFIRLVQDNTSMGTLYVNNNRDITDTPYNINVKGIDYDQTCPNFQGISYKSRVSRNMSTRDGLDIFPNGFCVPWSFIVIATYLTHGKRAIHILKDFMTNTSYYKGFKASQKPELQLLVVHLISVYLTEIGLNQ